MTTIKIVTDSSIGIEPELAEVLDITIVPLSVMVNGILYSDNDLKKEGEFLELMKSSKDVPKTSQPPVGLFAETYEKLAETADEIISIHLSHALSGTVEAARQGAVLSGQSVTVIDSGFADQAIKFQVVEAAKMAKEGASVEDIIARIKTIKEKTQLFIAVSTLENLVKGGRISRAVGLLSSLLNIKVIMEMVNDELIPVAKGRGNKTFSKWLANFKESLSGKEIVEIGVSYAGKPDFANSLAQELQPYVEKPITVLETGSIVQSHTGENAWAIIVHYA